MSVRDRWARLTPYEVGIPGREFAERTFSAIREEAESREVDPADPGAFLQLGEVGRALRAIQGEERGGEALQRFGALLFHAYHFHHAGELVLLVETALARDLVEGTAAHPWSGDLPGRAGYLQLPRHLFWSQPEGETPPEPLDGIFWVRSSGDTLSLLVAMGLRPDRPGLSLIDFPPLPLAHAPRWVSDPARGEGEDFSTTLPGGELDRLYSVVTMGEALKLAGRAFAYLTAFPEALGSEERSPRSDEKRSDPAPKGPEGGAVRSLPSILPFRRLRRLDPADRSNG